MLGLQKQKIQLLSSENPHSGEWTRCINSFCSGRHYGGVLPRFRISYEMGKERREGEGRGGEGNCRQKIRENAEHWKLGAFWLIWSPGAMRVSGWAEKEDQN